MHNEACILCNLPPSDAAFLYQLEIAAEPAHCIAAEFDTSVGIVNEHLSAQTHFKPLQGMQGTDEWPFAESPIALFSPREGHLPLESTLRRLRHMRDVSRAWRDTKTPDFPYVVQLGSDYLTSTRDGLEVLTVCAAVWAKAFYKASTLPISDLSADEKRHTLATHQGILVRSKDLNLPEKIKQFGNAAVAVASILRSAGNGTGEFTFSEESYRRQSERQFSAQVVKRLCFEWFFPMIQNSKKADRNLYFLNLGDMIERESGTGDGHRFTQIGFDGLQKQLPRIVRRWDLSRERRQKLEEEIPGILGENVSTKQRRRYPNPDRLINGLEKGELGTIWGDVKQSLVSVQRKEDALKRGAGYVLTEIRSEQHDSDEHGPRLVEPPSTENPESEAIVHDLAEKIGRRLQSDGRDALDVFLAQEYARRIEDQEVGQLSNRELAAKFCSRANGYKVSEETIRKRRNNLELLILSCISHKPNRTGATL